MTFSADPAGGNQARVVLDASGLDDAAMLALAAELGYSESAFLTGPGSPDAGPSAAREYTIRCFSPKAEVPFCGHATVATALALAERDGPGDLVFHTVAGAVPVTVAREDTELRATLTSVEPRITDITPDDLTEALDILRWPAADLDPALPPWNSARVTPGSGSAEPAPASRTDDAPRATTPPPSGPGHRPSGPGHRAPGVRPPLSGPRRSPAPLTARGPTVARIPGAAGTRGHAGRTRP
ncbi:PhzF family phenazine biosynthesis isomerase [Streptomyces sp. NPDC002476]|uniref:PhzF family phenazine biosynthesis isomerase n=1 Tax=Streptomyces sp. NPDC002476 TaxID=3364648 RepID=UPI0036B943EA